MIVARLMRRDWCYVVRSDRTVVTVPHRSRLERLVFVFLWDIAEIYVNYMFQGPLLAPLFGARRGL